MKRYSLLCIQCHAFVLVIWLLIFQSMLLLSEQKNLQHWANLTQLIMVWIFSLLEVTTSFSSKPANPSYVEEKQDITLIWKYTLNGQLGSAQFSNVTGGGDVLIGKTFSTGSINVQSKYQERFRADISNTQARLTILTVQRSDQGQYEFELLPTGAGKLNHVVEVIVKCK